MELEQGIVYLGKPCLSKLRMLMTGKGRQVKAGSTYLVVVRHPVQGFHKVCRPLQ